MEILILAGGVGSRVGFKLPKQYITLKHDWNSIDFIFHNLKQMKQKVTNIVVVCDFKYKKYFEQYKEITSFVENGVTRNQSIKHGLAKIKGSFILIDGVRPFITSTQLDNIIGECSAVYASTFPSALYKVKNNLLIKVLDKESLFIAETPQFYTQKDKQIIEQEIDDKHIDVSQILIENNIDVKILNSSFWKVKITTVEDLKNVKKLL